VTTAAGGSSSWRPVVEWRSGGSAAAGSWAAVVVSLRGCMRVACGVAALARGMLAASVGSRRRFEGATDRGGTGTRGGATTTRGGISVPPSTRSARRPSTTTSGGVVLTELNDIDTALRLWITLLTLLSPPPTSMDVLFRGSRAKRYQVVNRNPQHTAAALVDDRARIANPGREFSTCTAPPERDVHQNSLLDSLDSNPAPKVKIEKTAAPNMKPYRPP
jgi:hypothetical protein